MSKLLEYKCPGCGGAVTYDSALRMMKCEMCSGTYTPEQFYEKTVDTEMVQTIDEQSAQSMVSYICGSCGGEIICDRYAVTTQCPFCMNPMAVLNNISGRFFPKLILPFEITSEQAEQALKKHLKSVRKADRKFVRQALGTPMQGMYIPVWVIDSEFTADTRRASSFGLGTMTSKGIDLLYSRIPIPCTDSVERRLLNAAGHFDFSQAMSFDPSYLSGYYFHRSLSGGLECEKLAEEAIRKHVRLQLYGTGGQSPLSDHELRIQRKITRRQCGVAPIWLVNVEWKDRMFQFVINGVTGKVAGGVPLDSRKHARATAWSLLLKIIVEIIGIVTHFGDDD